MIRLLLLVTFLAVSGFPGAQAQSAGQAPTPPESEEPTLRVMSFNIRYGTANDGDNAWPNRRDHVAQTIEAYGPDLLGIQEALDFQVEFLQQRFADYAVHGVGRDDGKQRGEYAAIFYRRDRFELLDAGHFWLSQQPETPGSVSWDSSLTRMASWLKLRDTHTGQTLTVCNTHWDHRGEQARLESARLIRKRLSDARHLIVMGDLNCTEDSAAVQALLEGDALRDTYRAVQPDRQPDEASFNRFTGQRQGSRIDFIFCADVWRPTAATIDRTQYDGRCPSDHYPVTATLIYAR